MSFCNTEALGGGNPITIVPNAAVDLNTTSMRWSSALLTAVPNVPFMFLWPFSLCVPVLETIANACLSATPRKFATSYVFGDPRRLACELQKELRYGRAQAIVTHGYLEAG